MGSMCSMYAVSRDTCAKRLMTNQPLSLLAGACTADAIFVVALRVSLTVDFVVDLGALVVVAFLVLVVLVAAFFDAPVLFVLLVVTLADSAVDFVRERARVRPPCLVCAAVVRGSGRGGLTSPEAHRPSSSAVFPVVAASLGDSSLADNVALGAGSASILTSLTGSSSSFRRVPMTCSWRALGSHP